jgi:hypothetical protein
MYVLQGRGGPGMASNVGWSPLFSSLFSCICFSISDSPTLMGCHRWSETVNWVVRYWGCKSSSACWSYACNTCCICDGWCSWWSSNCKCQNGLPVQYGLGNDPLTHYLARMSRHQLHEIMSELKVDMHLCTQLFNKVYKRTNGD